jgi:short-subunit dehydrogenase
MTAAEEDQQMNKMTTEKRDATRRTTRLHARYGPWAVVTGASDGIGREFALRLAAGGLDLVIVARRRDVLEQLGTDLEATTSVRVLPIAADLATPDGVRALVDGTSDLDVGLLVAAAGFGTSGRFIDAPVDDELGMIDVNCRAVAALAHHFGNRFATAGRGGLVLMSSLLAVQGVPRAANYAATKAYVQSLAEALRLELSPLGVDVVSSAPGPIQSGFARRADMTMSMAGTPASVAQGTLDALGRAGTVRPGLLSKFLELSLAFLPRWGRVRMMGLVMAGMTKHHGARPLAMGKNGLA